MSRIKIFNIATDKHLEDFAAGKIITQSAAAKRMRMGSSTLLLLRTPGAVEYDPSFPMPIKLGKALGYYAKDIDKYTKNAKKASTHLQYFMNTNNAPQSVKSDSISKSISSTFVSSEVDFIIGQLLEMNTALYELSLIVDPKTFNTHYKAKNFYYQDAVVTEVKDIVDQYRASKSQLHIRTKLIERAKSLMDAAKVRLETRSNIVIDGKVESIMSQTRVASLIGVSATTVANRINPNHGSYDPTFPKPIEESKGNKKFKKCDIQAWLNTRP